MTPGSSTRSSMIPSRLSAFLRLSSLRARAIIVTTTIWDVYALVDATPISAPALMCTPQWVSRAMADPTVLVTPTQRAPLRFTYSRAPRVSAVSPDWLTNTTVSSRNMGALRSTISEASSRDTGTPVSSSISAREASAAWYEVPQAMKMMRRLRRMVSAWSVSPPSTMRLRAASRELSDNVAEGPCCMTKLGERMRPSPDFCFFEGGAPCVMDPPWDPLPPDECAGDIAGESAGDATAECPCDPADASLRTTRPRMDCRILSGCSWISFCMKWLYLPFMI
mmetsp:Transcript_63331/g.200311  ORF Transcript_63331/g.200311 Transcript_63331/m.200311 type:complete len:280 (-) Transcript_63331:1144-1983(-)